MNASFFVKKESWSVVAGHNDMALSIYGHFLLKKNNSKCKMIILLILVIIKSNKSENCILISSFNRVFGC